jgi:hypothetical protein
VPSIIVDAHTRIWDSADQLGQAADHLHRRSVEPWQRPDASVDAFDRAMAPVGIAFILGFESLHLGASIPIEQVARYVLRHPGKYIGFAGIDPTAPQPLRQLDRALTAGLQGLTLSPAAQSFHPTDTRAMALYEACEAQNIPIIFDADPLRARDAKLEFAQPYLLDEVARTFPKLKLVVSSLGQPWIDQTLALLAKHQSVFADLGDLLMGPWRLYDTLLMAQHYGVASQLLFASHFPFFTPEKAVVAIYSVNTLAQGTHLPTVPREQLRALIERDTLRCLGLKQPQPARSNIEQDVPADQEEATP